MRGGLTPSIFFFASVVAFAFALDGCGDDDATPTTSVSNPCTPGQSAACTGAGGCSGGQVCKADGTFDVCVCGAGGQNPNPNSDAGNNVPTDAASDAVADGASGDSGPPGWTPIEASGLVLWLDAAKGVMTATGNKVTKWTDQSSKHNDVAPTGAATAESPVLESTMGPGGKPAIHFTNSIPGRLFRTAPTGLGMGGADIFIEVVVLPDQNSTYFLAGYGAKGDIALNGSSSSPATAEFTLLKATSSSALTKTWHMLGAFRFGMAAAIRVDGAVVGSATGGVVTDYPESLEVSVGASGRIAEVVAVRAVSGSEITKIEAYFKQKYGL